MRRRRPTVTPSSSMPTTVRPVSTVTPSCSSDRSAFAESDGGKLGSTRSAASTSRMRRGARVDRAEVAAQRVARELGDLAGHLDAGRAGADDDEGEPRGARCAASGSTSAASNARQDAAADDERALERLHLGGVLAPLVVAEVGVAASRRRRSACRRGARPAPARRRPAAGAPRARRGRSPVDLGHAARARCGRA